MVKLCAGAWSSVQLAQLAAYTLVRLRQLRFQARQLRGAAADELELTVEMAEGLAQELTAALGVDIVSPQLGADRGAGVLGGEQRLELLERYPEQLFQAQHLAQALDLGLGVYSRC